MFYAKRKVTLNFDKNCKNYSIIIVLYCLLFENYDFC